MPATTNISVGSSDTRLAEGTTVCSRCSKKVRKRRAISADSISGRPSGSGFLVRARAVAAGLIAPGWQARRAHLLHSEGRACGRPAPLDIQPPLALARRVDVHAVPDVAGERRDSPR